METVRFVTKFEDFADSTVPYMFHCHMLTHEDGGMMGQFVVVGNSTNAIKGINTGSLNVFPNPSNGIFRLVSDLNNKNYETIVTSADGKQIIEKTFHSNVNEIEIDLSYQAYGIYVLTVITDNDITNFKLIKN